MSLRADRSLAVAAAETFALRGGGFVIAIATNVVISRGLGPEGRGQYALVVLGALILTLLGKLGLEHANVYLLATARIPSERLAGQNLFISIVAGLAGAAVLVTAPVLLPAIFEGVPVGYLVLASVIIPLGIHTQLAAGLQNLEGLVSWQFRAGIAGAAVQLAVAAALASVGRLDVLTALFAYVLAGVVTWLLVVLKHPRRTLALRFDRPLLALSLRYAVVVHLALVLLFLQTRVNLFAVKAFLDTAAVGQYSLAVSLAETFLLAADSFALALLPRQATGPLAGAARLSLQAARIGGLLTTVAIIPGAALGQPLIPILFGPTFAPAYAPFVWLLPGAVFMAVQRYCGPPALRANDPARILRIYLLGLLANVLLSLWWIPALGLTGGALATSVSYGLTAALFVRWVRHLAASTAPSGREAAVAVDTEPASLGIDPRAGAV